MWVPSTQADSMTQSELDSYRMNIKTTLDAAGEAAGRQLYVSFSAETLKAAGATRAVPPFAVTCSSDYDESVGRCALTSHRAVDDYHGVGNSCSPPGSHFQACRNSSVL